jgi:uncharacterized paraquat-inducible protein A
MAHSYESPMLHVEECPKCGVLMHPVDSGQPYPDTVHCPACRKVIWRESYLDLALPYLLLVPVAMVFGFPIVRAVGRYLGWWA